MIIIHSRHSHARLQNMLQQYGLDVAIKNKINIWTWINLVRCVPIKKREYAQLLYIDLIVRSTDRCHIIMQNIRCLKCFRAGQLLWQPHPQPLLDFSAMVVITANYELSQKSPLIYIYMMCGQCTVAATTTATASTITSTVTKINPYRFAGAQQMYAREKKRARKIAFHVVYFYGDIQFFFPNHQTV